jgi:hypothetical protein
MNNHMRLYWPDTVEGSAHALLPGQWNGQRAWGKFIQPQGAAAVQKTAANPPGHYRCAWSMPITAGEMALRTQGDGRLAANLYPSRNMSIDLTGSGDLDAIAALVVSMICAMGGSGTLAATIQGRQNMSINFAGSGGLDAAMTAVANMTADLVGTGDLAATIAAYGNMDIDIVVTGTGLTTANVGDIVADAVWTYLSRTLTSGGGGGGGLTQQDVRDALKLAASAGTPAAGSVDAKLNDIGNNTGLIPALL